MAKRKCMGYTEGKKLSLETYVQKSIEWTKTSGYSHGEIINALRSHGLNACVSAIEWYISGGASYDYSIKIQTSSGKKEKLQKALKGVTYTLKSKAVRIDTRYRTASGGVIAAQIIIPYNGE